MPDAPDTLYVDEIVECENHTQCEARTGSGDRCDNKDSWGAHVTNFPELAVLHLCGTHKNALEAGGITAHLNDGLTRPCEMEA